MTEINTEINFEELLVQAVTGHPLSDFEDAKQAEIKEKCVKAFDDFIVARGRELFGEKTAYQIRDYMAGHDNPVSVTDIEAKVEQLTDEFFEKMEQAEAAEMAE